MGEGDVNDDNGGYGESNASDDDDDDDKGGNDDSDASDDDDDDGQGGEDIRCRLIQGCPDSWRPPLNLQHQIFL